MSDKWLHHSLSTMQILRLNHSEAEGGGEEKALTIHEVESKFSGSDTLPHVLFSTLFGLLAVFLFQKWQW